MLLRRKADRITAAGILTVGIVAMVAAAYIYVLLQEIL